MNGEIPVGLGSVLEGRRWDSVEGLFFLVCTLLLQLSYVCMAADGPCFGSQEGRERVLVRLARGGGGGRYLRLLVHVGMFL